MTNVPYMASSFLALYFVLRYTNDETTKAYGITAVGFILASVFVRLIGLELIAGVFLFVLAKKISGRDQAIRSSQCHTRDSRCGLEVAYAVWSDQY